ncbi:MAG: hypothetical protein WCK78_02865 [Paludibacter sp.]
MNIFILVVIIGVFMASVSQLLLKQSALLKQKSIIKEYLNVKVILAYSLFGLSVILNIIAMKYGVKLKEIPILETLGYLFVFGLSFFLLKERLNKQELIATVFILIGVIVFYL